MNFNLKEKAKDLLMRCVLGISIFIVPNIAIYIFSSVTGDDQFYEVKQCAANVTIENIQYYEKLYDTYYLVEMIQLNPSKGLIEKAKKKVQEASSWAREDHVVDFLAGISKAETKMEEKQKRLGSK